MAPQEKTLAEDTRMEEASTTDEVVYYVAGERRVYVPGSVLEKRMVRKIDLHMFTCVCTLYLLNCEFTVHVVMSAAYNAL